MTGGFPEQSRPTGKRKMVPFDDAIMWLGMMAFVSEGAMFVEIGC